MIVQFFCSMVLGIVRGIFTLIPAWGVDTSTLDSARSWGGNLGAIDGWFPLTFMLGCVTVILGARLFFWVWTSVVWIYHQIPFNG